MNMIEKFQIVVKAYKDEKDVLRMNVSKNGGLNVNGVSERMV